MAICERAGFLAMTLGLGLAGCGGPPAAETAAHPAAEPETHAAASTRVEAPEPFIVPSPVPKLPDPGQRGGMAKPEELTAPTDRVQPATPDPAPSTAPAPGGDAPK